MKSCHECQISKPNLHPRKAPQGMSETPNDAWEFIAFDLIGPLAMTENGNKYVLVGIDVFSKKVYAAALTSKHATIVKREIRRIILSFPKLPRIILTDNGGEFSMITNLCEQLRVKHNQSAPYHPQTNGAVERANQTLKSRIYASNNAETWDDALDEIIHSINCSENVVTGFTPFEIETGETGQNIHDNVEHEPSFRQNVAEIRRQTRTKIVNEKNARNQRYQNPNFQPFKNGELVLIKNRTQKHPRFLGPLKIIEVRADGLSYTLENVNTGVTFIRHCSQLKIYRERRNEETQRIVEDAEEPTEEAPERHEPFMIPGFLFPIPSRNKNRRSTLQTPTDSSNAPLILSQSNTVDSSPVQPTSSDSSDTLASPSLSQSTGSSPSQPTPASLEAEGKPSDQLDDTVYESAASEMSSTSSTHSGSFTAITIDNMTVKELQEIARQHDVARAGPKKALKKRLILHLKSVNPHWPTDENGVLLFEIDFVQDTEVELSTEELFNSSPSVSKSPKVSNDNSGISLESPNKLVRTQMVTSTGPSRLDQPSSTISENPPSSTNLFLSNTAAPVPLPSTHSPQSTAPVAASPDLRSGMASRVSFASDASFIPAEQLLQQQRFHFAAVLSRNSSSGLEDQLDQPITEPVAPDISETGSTLSGSFTAITINKMTIKELQDVARQNDLVRAGPKQVLKQRIVSHFKTAFPLWPTDEKGILLFEIDFAPETEVELSTKMTKNELLCLMTTFKIPKPAKNIFSLGVITKDTYVKHIDEKFRLLYPDHPRNSNSILIFSPEIQNTPTPYLLENAQ